MLRYIVKIFIIIFCLTAIVFPNENEINNEYKKGMESFEQGKYGKCIRTLKKILRKYPHASNLGVIQEQIGRTYEKQEKYKKAFKAYENIFQKYTDYNNFEEIVEREFNIAQKYANGELKSVLGIDFAESNKTALEIYDRVIKNFPFGKYAGEAFIQSIKILFKTEKYKELEEKISLFKKTYENSPLLDEVMYYEGLCYYDQIKKSAYDQTNTKTAIEKFKEYLKAFPNGKFKDKISAMQSELINITCEKAYNTASFYVKEKNKAAAEKYFNDIISNYPDTQWANMAREGLKNLNK